MYLSRALLGVSLVASAVAQTPLIGFTRLPDSVVTVGQPVELAWSGGDGRSPVTIILKQGDPTYLATVAIITGNATGTTYTWTPSPSLPPGSNYNLQISQGVNDVNYSGQFAIVGASSTTAANSTAPATTAVIIAGPSGTTTIAGNATAIITVLSSGTGTALPRNTTFSSQMLSTETAATAATTVKTGATVGVSAGAPTGTAGGSGASGTASASPTGGASQMAGSSLALVFCAAVGIWVLN